MNMHEQATKPLNWHLWQCRLGWATEWLDTNHAILSHVGPVSKVLFGRLVVGGLSPSRLCSSDSVGAPADHGVEYPYDTPQTFGWRSLASSISETQPKGIVIVVSVGAALYSTASTYDPGGFDRKWPQKRTSNSLDKIWMISLFIL